ncbi:MAG: hypothetical protein AMXMBFR59_07620 [Rhodanobacteraceae bacterium]
MPLRYALLSGFLALFALGAQADDRAPALDRKMPGPRSVVLVLGSPHLSAVKHPLAERLQPMLDRLAAFAPDIITIENLSGEQCDLVARHPSVYPKENLEPYCVDTGPAKAATGLDVPAAIAEYHALLRDWPAQPGAAQRRRLAAVFLAAGEHPSALVQWLQLPVDERRAGDGLDATLVARLEKLSASNNESYSIGARLAARLGLARVHAVDDHTGDNLQIRDEKAFGDAVRAAWEKVSDKAKANRTRQDDLANGDDLLALYRFTNRPDVLRTAIENDFALALGDTSPQRYGRHYVAGWETRNLRMVANIGAAFRERPGARVLAIVGSSHKPWFDGLLGQMQGVDVIDAEDALK